MHFLWQSSSSLKLFLFPSHPPKMNCSHLPDPALKYQRGMAARHMPTSIGSWQAPSSSSFASSGASLWKHAFHSYSPPPYWTFKKMKKSREYRYGSELLVSIAADAVPTTSIYFFYFSDCC